MSDTNRVQSYPLTSKSSRSVFVRSTEHSSFGAMGSSCNGQRARTHNMKHIAHLPVIPTSARCSKQGGQVISKALCICPQRTLQKLHSRTQKKKTRIYTKNIESACKALTFLQIVFVPSPTGCTIIFLDSFHKWFVCRHLGPGRSWQATSRKMQPGQKCFIVRV